MYCKDLLYEIHALQEKRTIGHQASRGKQILNNLKGQQVEYQGQQITEV